MAQLKMENSKGSMRKIKIHIQSNVRLKTDSCRNFSSQKGMAWYIYDAKKEKPTTSAILSSKIIFQNWRKKERLRQAKSSWSSSILNQSWKKYWKISCKWKRKATTKNKNL